MNKESHEKLRNALRDLLPLLAARGSDIEKARRLPPDLLDQLKSAGVFRMFVPESHGGYGLDLRAGMDILEAIGRADGSAGWTVMIGSETPQLLALLPRERFDAIYAAGPDVIIGGGFNAQGEAHVVEGGYSASGRWNFASGCEHADYLLGNCVVMQDGQPRPGSAEGTPELRSMLFRKSDVRIIDTWNVLGLRGTGSHDIAVESAFCPVDWTFDIFQGAPSIPGPSFIAPVLHFVLHLGAVGVGIAQGALDAMVAVVNSGKKRLYARASLAESPVFQVHLGRADMNVRAARALAQRTADELWAACSSDPASIAALAPRVSAVGAWVTETACAAVDACYRAGGGGAARDSSPLQRRFRDIHTLSQHAALAEGWLGQAGAGLLGQPTGFFT
ncbi:MAG TPA: acyl-CoA dehydrogenase family protein [Polyangiaceae bacterium]|jgi:alkylation response protein AidB-like acyl-CoA dehydrogenase|nr:acyl-CoA dehydrogenase family protein [Polyangiaceae bacterium]